MTVTPKERMVCVLAALMARGTLETPQLRRYIRYALNMGFEQPGNLRGFLPGRLVPWAGPSWKMPWNRLRPCIRRDQGP